MRDDGYPGRGLGRAEKRLREVERDERDKGRVSVLGVRGSCGRLSISENVEWERITHVRLRR